MAQVAAKTTAGVDRLIDIYSTQDSSASLPVGSSSCHHVAPLGLITISGSKTDLTAFRKCPLCTIELSAMKAKSGSKKSMVLSADDAEESIAARFDLTPVTENVEAQDMKKEAKYFSKRGKDAMQDKFSHADTTGWSNDDPPRIWTIMLRAKKRSQMLEITPDDNAVNNFVTKLKHNYKMAFGEELRCMIIKETDDNQFIHMHVLSVIPRTLSNGPVGRGAKYGHLNGLPFMEWVERMTGELSSLKSGFKKDENGVRRGLLTWVPEDLEVPFFKSIEDRVTVFIIYSRKEANEKLREKARVQHRMPQAWIDKGVKRMNWFYLIGMESREQVLKSRMIYSKKGMDVVRDLLHHFVGNPERKYKDMLNKETGEMVNVDISYYSNQRNQPRGGTLRGALTDWQLTTLLAVIDFYNETDEEGRWEAALEQQGMAVPAGKRTRTVREVSTRSSKRKR